MTRWVAAALAVTLAACAPDGDDETAAADSAAAMRGMPMESGMMMDSSLDHSGMMSMMMMDSVMMMDSAGGMRGGRMMQPAQDVDQMFLRMMSDHHEGLVQMSMKAMDEGSTDVVKGDAHALHLKQAAERDSMVAMLRQDYQEQHKPTAMHKNMMQADSLAEAKGAEYDRAYYRMVIDHHQEGVMMIDHMLPRLQKPAVRQLAERMKQEQQREIQDFQQKLSRTGSR